MMGTRSQGCYRGSVRTAMRTKLLINGAILLALTACSASAGSSLPTATPASSPSVTVSPSSIDSPTPSPTTTPQLKTVPVVLAIKDIPASTQLIGDMITVAMYSEDQAPPFAFHAPQPVVGKYTIVPIHTGQAITDNVVSSVRVTCSPH